MAPAELYGLILAGGKSSRMGQEKALLNYHGEAQGHYCLHLLKKCVGSIFLSCRAEQWEDSLFQETFREMPVIFDGCQDRGPMSGLLAAMEEYPSMAWLVMACDMPNVTQELVCKLISQRDAQRLATGFHYREETGNILFEPLFAIYEPTCLSQLQKRAQEQRYSLHAWLEQAYAERQIHSVELYAEEASLLMSLNTPDEASRFLHRDTQGPSVP